MFQDVDFGIIMNTPIVRNWMLSRGKEGMVGMVRKRETENIWHEFANDWNIPVYILHTNLV